MKKIAFVVQRYGEGVNGGAELHCKILAEELSKKYAIEILTTTAIDYQGWANHYIEGHDIINNISVIRFKTYSFTGKQARKARRKLLKQRKNLSFFKYLGISTIANRLFPISEPTKEDANDWLKKQGPYTPELIKYIKDEGHKYDAFIFFTYLYYPTVVGMQYVADKSIFIPTAHDEPIIFTKAYEDIFSIPRFIMYNTEQEKSFVERNFSHCKHSDISGIGLRNHYINTEYKVKPHLDFTFKYFIYIGRIDSEKGCEILVAYFKKYTQNHPDIKLLLVGKNNLNIKEDDVIIPTGFIDEEDKFFLLKNSTGLIIPSLYESLSIVTLEAMIEGVPVIAHEKSEVIMSHLKKSGTGAAFTDYGSFEKALNKMLHMNPKEQKELSEKAKKYVEDNYNWEQIIEKFSKAIDFISQNNS